MRLLHATALVCAAVSFSGYTAAAQARSADVGLLVGLSSGYTLWIAPQDGELRVISKKPYLLVPRADGFWWVGTVQRCGVEEFNGEGMNITEAGAFLSRSESMFVARVGDTARVTLDGVECDVAERQVMAKRAASARAYADSLARTGDSTALHALVADSGATHDEAVTEDLECSINTRGITFVSASAISVEEREITTEFCSPAKYSTSGSNVVTRFNSTDQIPLRPLLRRAERVRVANEFSGSGLCGFEEGMTEDHVDDSWAVRREEGSWRAKFFVDGPLACRGGSEMELSPRLPSSFTGDAPLPLKWADIQRSVPSLRDAAADPTRAFMALIVGDTLSIVRVRDGRLAESLIKVPLGWAVEQFVMLRWATGAEIARWNRVIPKLSEPVVIVTPPPA